MKNLLKVTRSFQVTNFWPILVIWNHTDTAVHSAAADLVFVELTNARVSWLSVARKDSIFLRFSQDGVEASSKSTTAKLNEHEKSH